MAVGLYYNTKFPWTHPLRVSVLIPTRGRPKKLLRALESLMEGARELNKVEFIFRVDEDDEETTRALSKFSPPHKQLVIGPRGKGYWDLHLHLTAMAALSRGNWLMNFNDDAVMCTKNWDMYFSEVLTDGVSPQTFGCKDGIYALVPKVEVRPDSWEFFAVHRRVYEVLGRLGIHTGVDEWLRVLFQFVMRWLRVDIVIAHENEDDQVLQEGRKKVDPVAEALLSSPSILRGILEDAGKLLDYMESYQKSN